MFRQSSGSTVTCFTATFPAAVAAVKLPGPPAVRAALVTLEHPEVGPARHSGNPIRVSRTPWAGSGAAPCLGAHTEEVLVGVLGLAREEVARLAEDGVCR